MSTSRVICFPETSSDGDRSGYYGSMIQQTETDLLEAIDAAIISAGHLMDLDDVSEDGGEEEFDAAYEARFHCGTCMVRTVLDTVWPSVQNYIEFVRHSHAHREADVLARRVLEFLVAPSEEALQQLRTAIDAYLKGQA